VDSGRPSSTRQTSRARSSRRGHAAPILHRSHRGRAAGRAGPAGPVPVRPRNLTRSVAPRRTRPAAADFCETRRSPRCAA
jgi:hypothetical protein